VGTPSTLEVDLVIGADGANSRVAKDIDAGEYDYAIAFQVSAAPAPGAPPCIWLAGGTAVLGQPGAASLCSAAACPTSASLMPPHSVPLAPS
jgi:2-polyprenyl-6-methoxyphenol hydroxylase-like FAD-dependent oxidoreductase